MMMVGGKGDVRSGGIYSPCTPVVFLDGSWSRPCRIAGSSRLSWGRHRRRARILCGLVALLLFSLAEILYKRVEGDFDIT